jgi:DNA-binding MarR family transcriptional regulator
MSASTPPPTLESIDELLLFRLSLLSAQTSALVVRLCEGRFGITRREWRVLGLLHSNDGMTPSALADHVQLDRARTSRAIGALVKKRLIVREINPSDRRGAHLTLTPSGQQLYRDLMPHVKNINRRILSVLNEEEMRQLESWIKKLHESTQLLNVELTPDFLKTYRIHGGRDAPPQSILD